MKNILTLLNKFFGALIVLNIAHQIVASAGFFPRSLSWVSILHSVSIGIFTLEFILRAIVERKFGILLLIDGLVILNYFLFPVFDLRVFRLFRLFDIFRKSKFLLPTNTLIKTIILQRSALLGTQFMVLSILLVVSTLIYFLESKVQPEVFGSIPATMWWGIATLTTVGYGDVVPATDLGKLLASFTMLIGIGMFALPAAILASAYYEQIQKRNFLISFEAIASVPLFQEVPFGAIGKINEKLNVAHFNEGETIFKKGDPANSLFIIEHGRVEVQLESTSVELSSGEYFGEMALIGDGSRNATIAALEDTKLLELTKIDLDELAKDYPVLFQELELTSSNRSG